MPLKKAFDRKDILIYPWYISDVVVTKDISRLSKGRTVKQVFLYIADGLTHVYYEENSINVLGEWFLKQIIKDHNFYHRVIKNIYDYGDELTSFCLSLKNLEPSTMSDRDLLKIYADYEKKLGDLRVWGWMPPILDGVFTPFLSDYLMAEFSTFLRTSHQDVKIADYYSLLSTSEKMSEVQAETLARLKLLMKIKKSGKNLKAALINKHLKKFGWLTYGYAGPVMDASYLLKVLAADLKNGDLAEQINKITKHSNSIKGEKNKLRTKLKLPTRLSYLFNVSAELMFIKDYRKGVYQKSYVAMDPIIAELANRLGLSNREIRNLILSEVKDALLNHKESVYRQRAKQRMKVCYYSVAQGKIKVGEGAMAKKLIAKLEKRQPKLTVKVRELKGSIAYSGLVRGRVKIILTKIDVPKLKTGEILVSSATNPDLISAMKKAAAFITDTGGIICHAAIVARELKKPCVIGTKIATQVLKDGDEVEVDANQGIVRILKQ